MMKVSILPNDKKSKLLIKLIVLIILFIAGCVEVLSLSYIYYGNSGTVASLMIIPMIPNLVWILITIDELDNL